MITESILIKILGAVAGAIMALVFIPPKTFNGLVRRTTASLIAGPIFSPVVHSYMTWQNTLEYWLAAAALTAFVSWWVLGVVVNAAKKIIGMKTDEHE